MRTSLLVHCVLLLASATSISARPIYSGTVDTSTGQPSYTVRAEHDHDHSHLPYTQSGTPEHHEYLRSTRTSAGGHNADQRPEHHYAAVVSGEGLPQGESLNEEAVRELPARFMYAHDIGHSIRAVEEIELLPRRLEARKKKGPKKPSSPPPKQSSSPQTLPSKPKKKHHIDGHKVSSTIGKIAKGALKIFKFRLRELEDEGRLVTREGS